MGQTKSKELDYKKGTDNLSAQAALNDINILRRLAENEGPIAVSAYIDKSLHKWKKEQDEEKIIIRHFHLTYIIFFLKFGS
jgi:hypothetical protein